MKARLLAVAAAAVILCGAAPGAAAQESDLAQRTVPIVKSVGCVEKDGESWFLTAASEPEETEYPFASALEVRDAHDVALGSNRFELVGVADFLDAEGLLALHQRAEHTAPESVNATGELAEGRKVAVKGLYITSVTPHRLNLTSAFSLTDTCG